MKINDLPVTLVVALCITAAALTAMSANAHSPDSAIDLNELKDQAQARFDEADANDDGNVSGAEFEATDIGVDRRRRGGWRGPRMGRGGPGTRIPSSDEQRGKVFSEADTDADGQLSSAEFDALPQAVRRLAQRRLFARLDADDDASLSLEEFPSKYTRMLALDSNADGQVTRDEMPRRDRHGRR